MFSFWNTFPRQGRLAVFIWLAAGCWAAQAVHAQTSAKESPKSLSEIFLAAWEKQPEAQTLSAREEAALAQARSLQGMFPEPPSVEIALSSDRFVGRNGGREFEIGVSVPLWLPGEQQRHRALAQGQGKGLESRTLAAKLKVAASVREAWWASVRARQELETAHAQQENAQRLAADVDKRVRAGDLSRADQHQAQGAVAAADALVAQAQAASFLAETSLATMTGMRGLALDPVPVEAEPAEPAHVSAQHPELQALRDRLGVSELQSDLLAIQSRGNPELKIATTRGRGSAGERSNQTLIVGVRVPLGSEAKQNSRLASARVESLELSAQLNYEEQRLRSEVDGAKARVQAARLLLASAEKRSALARESRGFFDKSFRLGETDLPTRLRIEAEAAEAQRLAVRSRIELGAAISAWRQSLGLLP